MWSELKTPFIRPEMVENGSDEMRARYLDVVVHGGVSGQLLGLLRHDRTGPAGETRVSGAAQNRSLAPGRRPESSAQRDPPLRSHDPAPYQPQELPPHCESAGSVLG